MTPFLNLCLVCLINFSGINGNRRRHLGEMCLTMYTSNSSRHLKGDSVISHRDRIKQTVEKERSPPDRERMSFTLSFSWPGGFTFIRHKLNEKKTSGHTHTLYRIIDSFPRGPQHYSILLIGSTELGGQSALWHWSVLCRHTVIALHALLYEDIDYIDAFS